MKTITSIQSMQAYSYAVKAKGKLAGFVPTMGYLHQGHLSLVKAAKALSDIVVVSIFVNPIQFGPREDYRRYPRDLRRDKSLLKNLGVDVVFIPKAEDMFPEGFTTFVEVEDLSHTMCGASRPGHFKGVTTVVAKLFSAVQPHLAFFGEKDFQQQVIIKKMVKDLNIPVKIIIRPTIREKDGLAISSRNTYLKKEERKAATVLYRALRLAKDLVNKGEKNPQKITRRIRQFIATQALVKIDYIAIRDPQTLEKVAVIKKKALVALAAYIGKTRLIDNMIIK